MPDQAGQPGRPVVRPRPGVQDPPFSRLIEPPRARPRHRRPRPQTRPRRPLGVRGLQPAMPPTMRRGRRNGTLSSRGPDRAPTLDQTDQPQPAGHAEPASTVFHVRSPLQGQSSLTAPSIGDRTSPQPFTKSVGSSSRLRRVTAGYSGTPLPRKLGIKPGNRVLLLGAPDDFEGATLGGLPEAVRVGRGPRGRADVIVSFHAPRADLARHMPKL